MSNYLIKQLEENRALQKTLRHKAKKAVRSHNLAQADRLADELIDATHRGMKLYRQARNQGLV